MLLYMLLQLSIECVIQIEIIVARSDCVVDATRRQNLTFITRGVDSPKVSGSLQAFWKRFTLTLSFLSFPNLSVFLSFP
jgi:hypothetical protein